MPRPFVHLHLHSEYSLLDGACRTADIAKRAKEWDMPAVALTDHGNLFGAIEFYDACKKAGVKAILGCECYLAPNSRFDKKGDQKTASSHFLLLAKNNEGWANLIKLVSYAHLEGMYYKPRIDRELLAKYSGGLIATSTCLKGEIPQAILAGNSKRAEELIQEMIGFFAPGDFYLEVQNHGLAPQAMVTRELIKYSKQFGLKLVATNDVHYIDKDNAPAHDVLLCIGTGANLNDEKRMRYPSPEFYMKSGDEMAALFPELPEALDTTLEIAEKCNVTIELGKNKFPQYPQPEGKTREEYLRELCWEGFKQRYGARAEDKALQERLDFELKVLEKTGFTSYFLIVWDFIAWAKSQGIPVGPGRGSAAGAMIAYVLGITDLDPLHYGLFFERFLNPERVSPPDIDVDFCYNRRVEVIDYVRRKYGETAVAQIITYGTLGAKASVRDVSRVLGLTYGESDRLAKMIPFDPTMTLERALNESPEFKQAYDTEETTKQVLDYALQLEGLSRSTGVHAAGVVIADRDLTEYVPLKRDDDGEGIVTQFSMDWLGELGMLKMDFLGLKTLTVIWDALKLIEQNGGPKITQPEIPLDDPKTYELLTAAKNIGLFQVESSGMCDACRRVKPKVIEDIIALVALYRPGPMDQINLYAKRKAGEETLEYPHPLLEPILKETYGIIIYQEQVMQAAQIIAGYTLGGADLLRRAMGKKKKEEMDKQRSTFVEGALKTNGIKEAKANELFDLLEKFAGYGFNKAHAACYGVLAVQTAWLKANYPTEFLAALLSNDLDNTDKIALFVNEARDLGIEILPPSINESGITFSVAPGRIRFGLAAIKGVGEGAVQQLVTAREKEGPFTSLTDLCKRVDPRSVNRKALESLAKVGAFDGLSPNRATAFSEIDSALQIGSSAARDRESGQGSLLDMLAGDTPEKKGANNTVKTLPEWGQAEKSTYEKELLGLYLSGHPLDDYVAEVAALQTSTVAGLNNVAASDSVRLVGMITKVEVMLTKKDKRPWARYLFEDQTGGTEAILFPDTYASLSRAFKSGEIVAMYGSPDKKEEKAKIRVSKVTSLQEARESSYQRMTLHLDHAQWSGAKNDELFQILQNYPGMTRLALSIRHPKGTVEIQASELLNLTVTEDLLNRLGTLLGSKAWSFQASAPAAPAKRKYPPRRAAAAV